MTQFAIVTSEVLAFLQTQPSDSFDALLCDPPYGLAFLNKTWDYQIPSVDLWRECFRVLKPGAPLLSFGGTRTYHRIAVAIEDAGFEIRDSLCWLYGKGFPKSQNISKAIDRAAGAERPVIGQQTLTGNAAVSSKDKGGTFGVQVGTAAPRVIDVTGPATDAAKQWDGYGTALKPGWEPIILARKTLIGTMVANIRAHGVGAINIDGCRVGTEKMCSSHSTGDLISGNTAMTGGNYAREPGPDKDGRWPANVALSHTEDCRQGECSPDCPVRLLDESVAKTKSIPYPANVAEGAVLPLSTRTAGGYSDSGGPSRFFYSAKVSTKERERGCEALPAKSVQDQEEGTAGGAHNHHPTLKPIALARWLATMIRPPTPNAVLLIPFSGAGSEIIGALLGGWPAVLGIEQSDEYTAIARARVASWVPDAILLSD